MADEASSSPAEVLFASFDEAKASHSGVAVLSGDYDGTIYLTVPMSRVRCTEDQLTTLLSDLDAITWMGGGGYHARVSYQDIPVPGRVVEAGDGGGQVVDGIWTHPSYFDEDIAALAQEVVEGLRQRLPGKLLQQRRAERLAQRRQDRESRPPVVIQGDVLPWDFDVLEPVVPFPDTDD